MKMDEGGRRGRLKRYKYGGERIVGVPMWDKMDDGVS